MNGIGHLRDLAVWLLWPRSTVGFLGRLVGWVVVFCIALAQLKMSLVGTLDPDLSFYVVLAGLCFLPFVGMVLVVMQRLQGVKRELAAHASTDPMTGLLNRRAFLRRAAKAAEECPKGVILLIDADNFKSINDTYGHGIGDVCISAVADQIRSSVRQDDIIGRLGGEEFGVYLCDVSAPEAREIGDRISRPFLVPTGFGMIRMTVSSGGAPLSDPRRLEQAISIADKALYSAKEQGRGRLILWTDVQDDAGPSDPAGPQATAA